jgi:predicted lipoprotein with Yx(FWY)xxD motif
MSIPGSLGRTMRPVGVATSGALLVLAMAGGSVAVAQSPAVESSPDASAAAGGDIYTITATTGAIGTYLSGEAGKTLYFFVPDSTPGVSTCTGDCAANWPPFVLEGTEQTAKGDGVTGVVGVVARTDPEGQQVTYDGRPLYYFSGDTAAGDTHGQGLFGKWFAATVDGSITSPAASPGASPAAPASMAPSGDVYTITAVTDTSGKLGTYLTGEGGKTLYMLTKDSPGKSVCSGDCAANWPAFVLAGSESVAAGAGVTGVVGVIAGFDGASQQVTYDGQPLYYFAGDKAAGDTNGQGKGGVWFVVAP